MTYILHPRIEKRTRSARAAIRAFAEAADLHPDGAMENALRDLIIDLAHVAEQHGSDVQPLFAKCLGIWAIERIDPVGVRRPPDVAIKIGPIKAPKAQRMAARKRRRA